jgi:NADPH:quinone reductase-like Zn-dependent oxidoreductase
VTGFAPRDAMYGICDGSFAGYARVRTDKLARKPANVSFDQAGSVPISGLTALQVVRDHARVQPGRKMLMVGASGGVGGFAVQIAQALAAEVTGVCSTAKVDLVRAIGADHVIDYTRDDFADGKTQYDVILDIGGNRRLSHLRRPHPPGTAGHRRRRDRRPVAGRRRPPAPGAPAVGVRDGAAEYLHLVGERR